MACILKEIRVLEVGQYSNGFTKDVHSIAASFHTAVGKSVGQREKREPLCTYCKGSHTANQCTVFKDHQQCTSIVKGAGLCFNCLAHRRVSQCTSHRHYKQCNQKHHTSLCPPPIAPVNNPQPPSAPVAKHTKSVHPQPPPPTSTTGTFTTVTRPQPSFELAHSACLLKTAIATVSAGPFNSEGNILLDEGAQCAFISQDLTDRLCLKATHTERVSLSSFGNPVSASSIYHLDTHTRAESHSYLSFGGTQACSSTAKLHADGDNQVTLLEGSAAGSPCHRGRRF